MRLIICEFIYKNLRVNIKAFTDYQLLKKIFKDVIKGNFPNVLNIYLSLRHRKITDNYIKSLIRLTREIVELSKTGIHFGAKRLAYDPNLDLPYTRTVIEPILFYLRELYPNDFQ